VSDPRINDPSQLGGVDLVSIFSYLRPHVRDFIRWLQRVLTDEELVGIIRADLGLSTVTAANMPQLSADQQRRVDEIVKEGLDENQKLEDLSEEDRAAAKLAAQEQLIEEASTAQAFADLAAQIADLVEIVLVFKDAVEDDAVSGRDVIMLVAGPFASGLLEARVPAAHALAQIFGLLAGEHHEAIDAIDVTGFISPFDELDPDEDPATFETRSDQRMQRIARAVAALVAVVDAAFGTDDELFNAFAGWDPEPNDDPKSVEIAQRTITFTLPVDLGAGIERPLVTFVVLKSDEGGPGVLMTVSGGWTYSRGPAFKFSAQTNGAATLVIDGDGTTTLGSAELLLLAEGGSDPAKVLGVRLGKPDATRLEIGHYGWRAGLSPDTGRWFLNAQVLDARIVIDLTEGNAFLRALSGKRIELDVDAEFIVDNVDGARFRGGSGAAVRLPLRRTAFGIFVLQYVELRTKFDAVAIELAAGVTFDFGVFRASLDRIGFTYAAKVDGEPAEFGALMPPSGIGLEIDSNWISGGGSLRFDVDAGEYSGVLQLRIKSWSINAIGMLTTKQPDGSDGTSFLVLLYLEFEVPLFGGIYLTGFGGVYARDRQLDTEALGAGLRSGALDDLFFPDNPVANAPRLLTRYREILPVSQGTRVFGLAVEFSFGKPATATLRLAVMAEWGDRETDGKEWLLVGVLHIELPPRELHARPYVRVIIEVIGVLEPSQSRVVIRGGLRDSFVGSQFGPRLTLTGEFYFTRWRVGPGDSTAWLGTLGGWHPDFKLLPPQVPTSLNRFGAAIKLGPVTMSLTGYFAFTPETYQFGFDFQIKASLGPAKLEGRLTLDAIIDRTTDQFTALVLFKASVKIWGRGFSVEVKGDLAGPSLWVFHGTAKVEILWKSFEVDIDVEAGSLPGVVGEVIDAIGEVARALESPDGRGSIVPPGSSVATLSAAGLSLPDELAHPLATLSISQAVAPFGVRLERIGERRLAAGPATLRVETVTIGDTAVADPPPTLGDFALGQFVTMSNEERLARTAFDRLPNGIAVGRSDVVVPGSSRGVTVEHETRRVNAEPEPRESPWTVLVGTRVRYEMTAETMANGASGRSAGARAASLLANADRASTSEPALVAVSPADLRPAASLLGPSRHSPTLAAALVEGTSMLVVPEYDLVEEPV
jgi:hypothetical protein